MLPFFTLELLVGKGIFNLKCRTVFQQSCIVTHSIFFGGENQ